MVVGDFGTGSADEVDVADAVRAYADTSTVAAVLTTGDNLYKDDIAATWTQPYGWLAERGIPVWATFGNHDVESATRLEAVAAAFGDPPRWSVHGWGQVTIVIVDSNQVENLDQLEWLESTLAGSTPTTIVSMHHPAYSCSTHGGRSSVQDLWVPLFGQHRVELVLAGHDHNYQRFTDAGVTYIVSGGGGQSLYPLKDCPAGYPERLSGVESHHFLVINQIGSDLRVEAMAVETGSFDQVQIATNP